MEGQAGRRDHPPSAIVAAVVGGTANDTPTSAASAAADAARAAARCRRAMAFTAAPAQRSEQRMSWNSSGSCVYSPAQHSDERVLTYMVSCTLTVDQCDIFKATIGVGV